MAKDANPYRDSFERARAKKAEVEKARREAAAERAAAAGSERELAAAKIEEIRGELAKAGALSDKLKSSEPSNPNPHITHLQLRLGAGPHLSFDVFVHPAEMPSITAMSSYLGRPKILKQGRPSDFSSEDIVEIVRAWTTEIAPHA